MAGLKSTSYPVLALALLLMAAIAIEIDQGVRFRQGVLKIRQVKPAPLPVALRPEYALPPESAFQETLARPIFVATRRTSSVSGLGPQAMKKGQFVLTGVTLLPTQRMALVKDAATGKTERVVEGKEVRGMLVEKVERDRIMFKQGEEREELVLKVLSSQPVRQPSGDQPVTGASVPAPVPPTAGTPAPQPPLQAPAAPASAAQPASPKMTAEQMQDLNRRRAQRGLPPMIF